MTKSNKKEKAATAASRAGESGAGESEGISPRSLFLLFLVSLALVAGFLYGLYVPGMRYLARAALDDAERWMARAQELRGDTAMREAALQVYDDLDVRMNHVLSDLTVREEYETARAQYLWEPTPENRRAQEERLRRYREADARFRENFVALLNACESALKRHHLEGRFPELHKEILKRSAQADSFFKKYPTGYEIPDLMVREEFAVFSIKVRNTLVGMRRVRDLFDPDAAYDQALRELTAARGWARTWGVVRKKLADYYHERDWIPQGLEEDLVVMRLDPNGALGRESFARIRRAAQENLPEGDYRLGVAYLLRNEPALAEAAFREFVGVEPRSPFVVKAWELIQEIEREEWDALQAFVEDEIWI